MNTKDMPQAKPKQKLFRRNRLLPLVQLDITIFQKKLFYNGINYIEPDFTITLPNGTEIYWEHVGMLGLDSYDENWTKKLDIYEKYYPGQMLKTYESGVIAKDAERMVQNIKNFK